MKLALHRSTAFWSGLLVMGFVCWAWRDSASSSSGLIYWRCYAEHSAGGLLFFYDRNIDNEWELDRRDGPSNAVMDGENVSASYWVKGTPPASMWPAPLWGRTKSRGLAAFLPYWFIVLGVATLWLGLLVWRARRRKQIITP